MSAPEIPDAARAAAAEAAAALIEPGMTIGLGSGRAVWAVAELLGASHGSLRAVVASSRTDEVARSAGIEVVELDGSRRLALAIDGADEIDPALGLLKGGGGALLREKIVVAAADLFVVVAETPKRVERLGATRALPVEVVRFGWRDTRRRLLDLLGSAERRTAAAQAGDEPSAPFLTDEGHFILDCALPAAGSLPQLAAAIEHTPGVVDHGLFLTEADLVLLGRADGGVERLER